jgi:predicted flap endonuclease-1-like 5' DNA nuclease
LGIGSGLSKRLEDIGICSFKQLSEITVEELIEQLVAKGARLNNKSIMASWAKQAIFADNDDIDGLKAFQNELKKG